VRPDGGSGGKGGDIILIGDKDVQSFSLLRKRHYTGNDGVSGYNNSKDGRPGKNLEICLPLGTIIYEIKRKTKVFKKADLR
jgi:GTP-binding protein